VAAGQQLGLVTEFAEQLDRLRNRAWRMVGEAGRDHDVSLRSPGPEEKSSEAPPAARIETVNRRQTGTNGSEAARSRLARNRSQRVFANSLA
jgi:hypothetical protein